MPSSTRLIRRRIKSIGNTKKITKAMELVAASKMRRAVGAAVSSRSYSKTIQMLVDDIRVKVDPTMHAFLAARKESHAAIVVIASSDRGLCGGFNVQLVKQAMSFLRSRNEKDLRIVTVGHRAELAVKKAGYQIVASFPAISDSPGFDRTIPIGAFCTKEFIEGRIDRVFVCYTDFRNAVSQVPLVKQLLPTIPEAELAEQMSVRDETTTSFEMDTGIVFEPDPKQVLDALLPRLVDALLYQALLESSASEHSARMLAMRNATDNATDMLRDLTLTYNQARQAGITREISEISAGKAAIE